MVLSWLDPYKNPCILPMILVSGTWCLVFLTWLYSLVITQTMWLHSFTLSVPDRPSGWLYSLLLSDRPCGWQNCSGNSRFLGTLLDFKRKIDKVTNVSLSAMFFLARDSGIPCYALAVAAL